jgi:TRAP-type C4-dicarboxylate transport system permease small subunit
MDAEGERSRASPVTVLASIHAALARVSLSAAWIGGAALLLAAFMVTVDVVARKLFGITMSGSDEITGYVFAGATTWAYAHALLTRSNIRIDALYNVVPIGIRAALDLLGLLLLLLYMAYLTVKGVDVLATSWARDSVAVSVMATPLWIPQAVWVTGLVFFNVTLAFLIVHVLVAFAVGGAPAVQAIAGNRTVQEEIAGGTHDTPAPEARDDGPVR